MSRLREQKYCSFCGKELAFKTLRDGSREKYCEGCDHVFFRTPSPSVIILVTSSNRVLLVKGVGWEVPYWGLIAGHVKVGETAEKTAVREVREEVGLDLTNFHFLRTYARKLGELMIAFKAEIGDSPISKSKELDDVRWFDTNSPLPLRAKSVAAQVVKHAFSEASFSFDD